MRRAVTIEVTFVGGPESVTPGVIPVEGLVRLPDDTLRPFCGWMDLLATLEAAAAAVHHHPVKEPS